MDVLWHTVLIKFHQNTPSELKDELYDKYQKLAEACGGQKAGIVFFKVDRNLDQRKGFEWVQIAIFTGNEALQAYRNHPKHAEITDLLRDVADWHVGDILAGTPTF